MPSSSGAKRPLTSTSGNSQPENAPVKRVRHRGSTKTSAADWDVTGHYALTCTSKYQPVDAGDYVLDVHYSQTSPHTRQLYAFFNFPNLYLTGVMRMCPKSALASQPNGKLFLSDFEAACELAEGVKPSPKSKEWLMRWRGEEDGTKLGGETRAQSQLLFEEGGRSLENEGSLNMHIKFAIVHKDKHLILEGTQLNMNSNSEGEEEDATPGDDSIAPANVSRMLEDWAQLYEPKWEQASLSDTDEDARELRILQDTGGPIPKPKNKWENPRTGRVITSKNKPGPIPGFIINATATSRYLEERPDWAWDITGKYEMSTIGLTKALGCPEGEPAPLRMTVQIDNYAKHQKAGRQFWAEFEANDTLAIARFRPNLLRDGLLPGDSLEIFEKACVLKPGQWVGPRPQGIQKFEMRWRGFSDGNEKVMGEDGPGTEVVFTKDDQGKTIFRGEMRVGRKKFPVVGIRVDSVEDRRPNAPTVSTEWAKYARGSSAVVIRKKLEHVIVMEKYCYGEFPRQPGDKKRSPNSN
ncbi:hypothetical protein AAE478_003216 [Parahypoxylon ruwenzoriense]